MKALEEPHAAKEKLIGNRCCNTSYFLSLVKMAISLEGLTTEANNTSP